MPPPEPVQASQMLYYIPDHFYKHPALASFLTVTTATLLCSSRELPREKKKRSLASLFLGYEHSRTRIWRTKQEQQEQQQQHQS